MEELYYTFPSKFLSLSETSLHETLASPNLAAQCVSIV